MAVELAQAYVSLIPSARGIHRQIANEMGGPLQRAAADAGGKASRSWGSKFTGGLKSVAKAGALGLAGALGGAVVLGKGLIDAAVESQKVTKQTEAVVKSMGGASKVTATQVANLSEKLSLKTGIDDELIQSGENVLLTFGKVRNEAGKGNDIFTQATNSALDMSVALGTDLKSANIQVGKALNDPIKGITALSRAGVSFTQQQKDQVKALVTSGDTLGAQKLIMSELTKQFSGSAAAQATSGEKLKVAFGNLQEQLGGVLLPIVEKVAGFLADRLPGAFAFLGKTIGPVVKKVGAFFKALFSGKTEDEGTPVEKFALTIREKLLPAIDKAKAFITTKFIPALRSIFQYVIDHKEILAGLAIAVGVVLVGAFAAWAVSVIAATWPIIAIIAAITAVAAAAIYAYKHFGWFKTAVDVAAKVIKTVALAAFRNLRDFIVLRVIPGVQAMVAFFKEKVWPVWLEMVRIIKERVIPKVKDFVDAIGRIIAKVKEVLTSVKEKFNSIVSFVTGLPDRIGTAASGMWDGIKDAFRSALNWIIEKWNNLHFGVHKGPINFDLDTPNITPLARGGLVTRPTLALVGEAGPEAVIPLSRSYAAAPVGVGNRQSMPTARDIATELARVLRTDGAFVVDVGQANKALRQYNRGAA